MKIIALMLAVLFLLNCTDKQKISELQKQNTLLSEQFKLLDEESKTKDDYIKEYTETVSSVFENLDRIRKREGFIAKYSRDVENRNKVTMRKKILSNIASIDGYIMESRRKLKHLKSRNNVSLAKIDELQKTLDHLTVTLGEKEKKLAELRGEIDKLSLQVASADSILSVKEEVITNQQQQINTAYYIIGDESELKEKGVITESGGFLGLRKTKKLASGFDTASFDVADIAHTSVIRIHRDIGHVRLISPHAKNSFQLTEIDNEQTELEIVNPAEFWKIRYLVIMTKG